jgi:quercetin dioxygenase-like cupin family protein
MNTNTEPVLDDALVEQLNEALAADAPLDAGTQARIKQRVLQRIAGENTPPPGPEGWQPFGEGVRIKVLHEADGIMSYLLRLAPGASLPAHRHPVDEECVVLEGELQIGSLRVAAGGFHLGRRNLLHDKLESAGGALIYLRGAVPEAALAL